MAKLQSKFEDEEFELVEASQSLGLKRKRGESSGPNVIGNLHEIEETKEEPRRSPRTKILGESLTPRKKKKGQSPSPRNKNKSRSPNMTLRKGVRSNNNPITGGTGTYDLVKQTANLSLG